MSINLLKSKSANKLSKEYQEVEYLESTGLQYIDSLVKIKPSYQIDLKVVPLNTASNKSVCASLQNVGDQCDLGQFQGYWRGNIGNPGDDGVNPKQIIGNEYIFHYEQGYWRYNGVVFGTSQQTDCPLNLYIFARNYRGVDNYSSNKLYYLKIWDENNVQVRNFIPCYRRSDNKPGLYDTINSVFYTNANTSATQDFIVGPEVGFDIQEVEPYILPKSLWGTPGLAYTLSNDGIYYICSGIGTATGTDIVIGALHNGKQVKEIANNAFRRNVTLKNVFVPDTITTIGDYIFALDWSDRSYTNLEYVNFGENSNLTTLGDFLFRYQIKLKRFVCPASVTSMGGALIYGCNDSGVKTKLIMLPMTPPSIQGALYLYYETYVPLGSISTYKTAPTWSSKASLLFPLVSTVSDLANIDTTVYTKACVRGNEEYAEYTYDGSQWNEVAGSATPPNVLETPNYSPMPLNLNLLGGWKTDTLNNIPQWNQVVSVADKDETSTGIRLVGNSSDNTFTLDGLSSATSGYPSIVLSSGSTPTIKGHKYLCGYIYISGSMSDILIPSSDQLPLAFSNLSFPYGNYKTNRFSILTASSTNNSPAVRVYATIGTANRYSYTNLKFKVIQIDLTKIFGAGNEPTTVAQFKALFPNDYYAYKDATGNTDGSALYQYQLVDQITNTYKYKLTPSPIIKI